MLLLFRLHENGEKIELMTQLGLLTCKNHCVLLLQMQRDNYF